MGTIGEKHFVAEAPAYVSDGDFVLIDHQLREVKVGRYGLQVGCHYITDAAFKKICILYQKVRGGER